MSNITVHATCIRSGTRHEITLYDEDGAKALGVALAHSSLWRNVKATRDVEEEVAL